MKLKPSLSKEIREKAKLVKQLGPMVPLVVDCCGVRVCIDRDGRKWKYFGEPEWRNVE